MKGCCVARYTFYKPNNYAITNNDASQQMDRIMLRFRPIAPKPTTSGPKSSSSGGSTDNVKYDVVGKRKRKRSNNNSKSRDDNNSISSRRKRCHVENYHVATLPLLPETTDLTPTENNKVRCNGSLPKWLCFGPSDEDTPLTAQNKEVIPSIITVEGVSDAWLDGSTLGSTDEEMMTKLDEDTCPGFVSDGWNNRVWWTNKEYRRMVTNNGLTEDKWQKEKLVSVRLDLKDKMKLPEVSFYRAAFTCSVRLQYGSKTMTVPCDVWRMNNGGFAWRLDVKAALTLSL